MYSPLCVCAHVHVLVCVYICNKQMYRCSSRIERTRPRVILSTRSGSGDDCEHPCRGSGRPEFIFNTRSGSKVVSPQSRVRPGPPQWLAGWLAGWGGGQSTDFDKEVYDFLTKVVILLRRSNI